MYYPKLTKEVLDNLLRTACEVSGKAFNDRLLELYWEMLREVPMKDVRKAFLAFNACATFPSCAKILTYCGYTPPATEPREQDAPPPATDEKPDNTFMEAFGSWTFEARYLGESKVGAEDEFQRCRQKLTGAGWKIEQEMPFECIAETQMGKHVKRQKLWKLHFLASRLDPNAPTPPATEPRTVSAMQKLQQKVANRISAAELATKVYEQRVQQKGAL